MDDMNSAQRLHDILLQARTRSGINTREMWAKLLNCDGEKDLNWAMLGLQALVDVVEDVVRASVPPSEFETYAGCFAPIRSAVSTSRFGQNWDDVKGSLSNDTMIPLKFCILVVAKAEPESAIADEERERLLTAIDRLEEDIRGGDLPLALRRVLLARLDDLRLALRHYNVVGQPGIKAALANAVGAIFSFGDEIAYRWEHTSIRAYIEMINIVSAVINARAAQSAIEWVVDKVHHLAQG